MKKEQYFTPDSVGEKARQMLRDVEELRKRHPLKLSTRKSALLVLDMQRYFLDEKSHAFIPSAPAIVPGIMKLIKYCEDNGIPVILTQHQNSESNAGMMSIWWKDLMSPESDYNEIIDQLKPWSNTTITKNQYDAFYQTDLEEVFSAKAVSQLIICGVMTHLCCETTARSAFVQGFQVFFTIDGTATYNEPFHRATLWNAAHGFAVPMLVDEIILECGSTASANHMP